MPVDRSTIDAQLREIGEGEHWWEQREFRALPYVLQPGEVLRGLVGGWLRMSRRPRLRSGGRWLIVATSGRILCLRQERMGRRQLEITREEITRIQQRGGFRSLHVIVDAGPRRYRFRVARGDALRFADVIAGFTPPGPRFSPEVEAFTWIPGMARVATIPAVASLLTRVAQLSPPAAPTPDADQGRVERLEEEIERLREQVEFLQSLLAEKSLPS